jgi:L-threonylcarbamoyladenylate synthase
MRGRLTPLLSRSLGPLKPSEGSAHPMAAILPATPEAIERAAGLLRQGRLVAFPTETVYGLGADATNAMAVAGIFEAKGRPRFNPLIVHVADIETAFRLGQFNATARRLARAFWPGPLTLVVPRAAGCPVADLTTAGLETIAVRVPSHPVAIAVLRATDRPVAAPSANRSGHVSATTAGHVDADLAGRVDLILDAGPCEHGVESTVVDVSSSAPRLLRPGAVTLEQIAGITGVRPVLVAADVDRPLSPGQLASHYAPASPVRPNARRPKAGEALLAFGPDVPPHDGPVVNLSATGDLREAAANLFAALRELDATGAVAIAVMPIPNVGLGVAINDRLGRAAAPRS